MAIFNRVKIISNDTIEIGGIEIILPCSISGYYTKNPFIVEKNGLTIVKFYPFSEAGGKALGWRV